MMKTISLLVNTLNEEKNIENNIKPISKYFDEIIVVDMSSEDLTVEKAAEFSTKVISVPRMGYVEPARKKGIEECAGDYIFILDADETLSEVTLNWLTCLRSGSVVFQHECYYIPRLNNMMGKDIYHGQFKPDSDKQLRLFTKESVIISEEIHKGILPKVNTCSLNFSDGFYIYHYHSDSAIQFVERLVRYCFFEKNIGKGEKSFNIRGTIKSFFREYIRYNGFKNGRHGFALAFILALRTFINGKK